MKLLAIETSCDETAAAVLQYENSCVSVLGEAVSSQIALHAQYGGVVPNLAAREHVRNIVPIVDAAMQGAKINQHELANYPNYHGIWPAAQLKSYFNL